MDQRAIGKKKGEGEATLKEQIRREVMLKLRESRLTLFPFLPERRIPNFKGADAAAEHLFEFDEIRNARLIKCNPDSAQVPFRERALSRGIDLLIATPRLTDGFMYFNAAEIGTDAHRAARKGNFEAFSSRIALGELPQPDAVVVGAVAVDTRGRRCGKGHGYADLECGILIQMGLEPCPIFSSVHDCQVVPTIPSDDSDLVLSGVGTPTRSFRTHSGETPWPTLDWTKLDEAQLSAMPLLVELRKMSFSGQGEGAESHEQR